MLKPLVVGILLFEEVEVLDFCGPFEVFSVTRLNPEKRREEVSPFLPLLISQDGSTVTTTGGMKVIPHHSFETCPNLDILCVPGGWGTRSEVKNDSLLRWVRERAGEVKLVTSVCTGSMVLGYAGLLRGKRSTTHIGALMWMEEALRDTAVIRDQRVVEDGDTITSAGISAGIDMALWVVGRYFGEETARNTAAHMEYPYPEDNRR